MAKTVMIVEDNELNMKLFHDLLEAHGYNIVGTRNGIEALDLARKHKPDLVLMDIQLPEVSGLEVTKWLKDDPDLKAIPVVAVTATTGIGLSSGSSLSHLVTSSPDTSGNWMSIKIRSGLCLRARSSASMPLRVPTVW